MENKTNETNETKKTDDITLPNGMKIWWENDEVFWGWKEKQNE